MEFNNLQVEDVNSFFNSFTSGTPTEEVTTQAPTQQTTEQKSTQAETQPEEGSAVEKFFESEDVAKGDDKKESSFKLEDVSKALIADNILSPFEDDSVPTTIEEFKIAIEGTFETKAAEIVERKFEEKFFSMSPVLQTIHRYAEQGVTTADELKRLIVETADYETIKSLDLANERNQEYIVAEQLKLSGLDEETIEEQINDLKALNKLQSTAEKFLPVVLKRQEEVIKNEFRNKELEQQQLDSYIETNSVNVQAFLEQPKSFLPFNIESQQYKSAIYQLAATPVAVNENKEPVFAWETYIKSLQSGGEEQYKEYLEIMAFVANKKKYQENIVKANTTKAATENFKKVKAVSPNPTNIEGFGSKNQQGPTPSNSRHWSV